MLTSDARTDVSPGGAGEMVVVSRSKMRDLKRSSASRDFFEKKYFTQMSPSKDTPTQADLRHKNRATVANIFANTSRPLNTSQNGKG